MSGESPAEPMNPFREELHHLRKSWGLFLALGMTEVVLGVAAITSSLVAYFITFTVVVVFGALLLIGGIVHLVNAFPRGAGAGSFRT